MDVCVCGGGAGAGGGGNGGGGCRGEETSRLERRIACEFLGICKHVWTCCGEAPSLPQTHTWQRRNAALLLSYSLTAWFSLLTGNLKTMGTSVQWGLHSLCHMQSRSWDESKAKTCVLGLEAQWPLAQLFSYQAFLWLLFKHKFADLVHSRQEMKKWMSLECFQPNGKCEFANHQTKKMSFVLPLCKQRGCVKHNISLLMQTFILGSYHSRRDIYIYMSRTNWHDLLNTSSW